jgi:hypothetical protein
MNPAPDHRAQGHTAHLAELDRPDARHVHGRHCYWDVRLCAWRCSTIAVGEAHPDTAGGSRAQRRAQDPGVRVMPVVPSTRSTS